MCVAAQVSTQPDAEIFAPIRRCLSEYLLHPDAFLDTGEAVVAALRPILVWLCVEGWRVGLPSAEKSKLVRCSAVK